MVNSALPLGENSLSTSEVFRRGGSPEGVKITFLSGYYAGKSLHLGSGPYELSSSQSANWEQNSEAGIRTGVTFKNISPRDLSIKVDFYSFSQDISQIAENIAHLQEIKPLDTKAEGRTPPYLRIQAGKAVYDKAICTQFRLNYKSPISKNKGFRYAEAEIEFQVPGGKDSIYQDAIPFAPTALGREVETQTVEDRQQEATKDVSKILLDSCLGEGGSKSLQDLIEQSKLGDVSALLQLDDRLFLQVAIAGLPSSVYDDGGFNQRLKEVISLELVRKEAGLQNPAEYDQRAIAAAIRTGDSTGVNADLLKPLSDGKTLFELLVTDYNKISESIKQQKLGSQDNIFDRKANPTAASRLIAIGSCGLTLRQTGVLPTNDPTASEAETLKNLNDFLQSSPSDEQIKKYFGLPDNVPETVINKLKNGRPYSSKEDFLNRATYNQQGVTGYSSWAGAVQTEQNILASTNQLLINADTTVEQIKERFGVDDEVSQKLKGKNLKNKQEFLDIVGDGGQKAWLKGWK